MREADGLRAQRRAALRDLLQIRVPVSVAAARLARFGWDSAEELVTLTRADTLDALARYATGELTAEDLQRWAEALEGRDDLALEAGFEDPLKEFLFEIATPEIAGALTLNRAQHWQAAFAMPES